MNKKNSPPSEPRLCAKLNHVFPTNDLGAEDKITDLSSGLKLSSSKSQFLVDSASSNERGKYPRVNPF